MKKNLNEENRKKYTIPSGASYQYRTKNAIFISPSNSIKHELVKLIICYQIRQFGDFKLSERIIKLFGEIETEYKECTKELIKNPEDFITEAVPKSNKERRIDIVKLNDERWIEIETNKKVNKGDCLVVYI